MQTIQSPVLLVIGNGLAIDLHKRFGSLEAWNPSAPIGWAVPNPSDLARRLLDDLPLAAGAILKAQAGLIEASDFEVFDYICNAADLGVERNAAMCQLRHYLGIAYSNYQARADELLGRPEWESGEFLRKIARMLLGVISYNYDLTLEGVLEGSGQKVTRLGVTGETAGGTPVYKPHGSIDYATAHNVYGGQAPTYPLWLTSELCDMPLRRLDRTRLAEPRYEVDLVLPAERSKYRGFQWVKPGRMWLDANADRAATVIFWGLSYWRCDQIELRNIVASTNRHAQCIVINPSPPPDFVNLLRGHYTRLPACYPTGGEALLDLK